MNQLQDIDNHFDEAWFAKISNDFSEADRLLLKSALDYVEDTLKTSLMQTQEPCVYHVKGVLNLLDLLQLDASTLVAATLVSLPELREADAPKTLVKEIKERFGLEIWNLVQGALTLTKIGKQASYSDAKTADDEANQKEMQRKMLLAMAADLRIVMIRLASRLQTLRWYSFSKLPCPAIIAQQTKDLYAPLANRLGIWQIKWELEDYSLRFLQPDVYHGIAKKLEATRKEREGLVNNFLAELQENLNEIGVEAEVSGRAKHIYSIYNKMRNKNLKFEELFDLMAVRIITHTERDCYATLAMVHSHWTPIMDEFDDYIARPKPNGYRSLHTVVADHLENNIEVQIRTYKMHEFAEYGMAAHWRYKESGAKGGQTTASSLYDRQISWMRQLLSWRREVGITEKEAETLDLQKVAQGKLEVSSNDKQNVTEEQGNKQTVIDDETPPKSDKIYVLTPQARVIELPEGSTAVDFAYRLHTDLGHRCRGAKIDGQLMALNTPLKTGQTVEIVAAKSGGPSRDWLNPQLGYLKSPRAKAKVRLWFNAIELQMRINSGHEQVDKELQRLGKTAINMDQLATKLGFTRLDDLYVAVAKDEFSLRNIAQAFEVTDTAKTTHEPEIITRQSAANAKTSGKSGVLVVGVDSLLTQLAGCCHPVPPDSISGFITRGRGVTIHRTDCPSFRVIKEKHPERVIEVTWGDTQENLYPVNILINGIHRKGLIKDIMESLSKIKVGLASINTQSKEGNARINITVEIANAEQLKKCLTIIMDIPGVLTAKRT